MTESTLKSDLHNVTKAVPIEMSPTCRDIPISQPSQKSNTGLRKAVSIDRYVLSLRVSCLTVFPGCWDGRFWLIQRLTPAGPTTCCDSVDEEAAGGLATDIVRDG